MGQNIRVYTLTIILDNDPHLSSHNMGGDRYLSIFANRIDGIVGNI
jgi:hypothetical protein